MHVNHDPAQTRRLPTPLKFILAIPLTIVLLHLLFLAFAGANDPMQAIF